MRRLAARLVRKWDYSVSFGRRDILRCSCLFVANVVSSHLAGPLPKFTGINVDSPRPVSAASPPPQFGGAGAVRVPPLNPDDVAKFSALFDKSDTMNGLITGMATLL